MPLVHVEGLQFMYLLKRNELLAFELHKFNQVQLRKLRSWRDPLDPMHEGAAKDTLKRL